jgi:hypothetical protein
MTSPFDRCAICGGTNEEHNELTKHVFTTKAGDLRPRPEVTERQSMKQPDSGVDLASRLIELLVDKEIITPQDALLCFGIKVAIPEEAPNARDSSTQQP